MSTTPPGGEPAATPRGRMSWSRIETLHTCPQKYKYRYEEGLIGGRVHEYENNEGVTVKVAYAYDYAMQFGSALHAALATIYDGTAFEAVHCPCEDSCDFCERLIFAEGPREGFVNGRWMYKCLAAFLIHYPWEPGVADARDKRNPRKRDVGVRLIHAYLERWRREDFEVLAVEQEFELTFEEFDYIGIMDLLIRKAGAVSPWDHKSTSIFGAQFDNQFKLSGQFTGYIEGAELCTKSPVASATANGLHVAMNVDTEDSFKRLETYRDTLDREVWRQSVQDDWSLIKQYRESGRWPRHAPTSCYSFNRLCEYYALCESGPAGHENNDLKRNNYIVHRRESAYD